MGSKFFTTTIKPFVKTSLLLHQEKLIEQHFDFIKCKVEDRVLICNWDVASSDYQNQYKIELRAIAGREPYSKIVQPESIIPCAKIHMYQDHSLCLHYPPDMKWHGLTPIYQYTIPWIMEWIIFYELYLVNGGIWLGRESPVHFREDEKNISEDLSE